MNTELKAQYDAIIARVRAAGNHALAESLAEQRDAKVLDAAIDAAESEGPNKE